MQIAQVCLCLKNNSYIFWSGTNGMAFSCLSKVQFNSLEFISIEGLVKQALGYRGPYIHSTLSSLQRAYTHLLSPLPSPSPSSLQYLSYLSIHTYFGTKYLAFGHKNNYLGLEGKTTRNLCFTYVGATAQGKRKEFCLNIYSWLEAEGALEPTSSRFQFTQQPPSVIEASIFKWLPSLRNL